MTTIINVKNVGFKDFYFIQKDGNFASVDVSLLFHLYAPMIGGRAISTYLCLANEENGDKLKIHQSLFLKLQTNPGEFFQDAERLESVGLLQTYLKEVNGIRYFRYYLSLPLRAQSFFDDVFLSVSLERYLGTENFSSLKKCYLDEPVSNDFEDVSMPIGELNKAKNKIEELSIKKTDFDNGKFFASIAPFGLDENSFSRKEIGSIIKLSLLYSLDEDALASIIINHYHKDFPMGKRVDFEGAKKECREADSFSFLKKKNEGTLSSSSEGKINEKVRFMDEKSPIEFLSWQQNRTKPIDADLKIAEDLSLNLGLPNGVINAILSYALQKNNNVLSKAYCEKLGAYLAREGVTNARDAMDALNRYVESSKAKRYYGKTSYPTTTYPKKTATTKENTHSKVEEEKEEEEGSVEDALKALDSLKK